MLGVAQAALLGASFAEGAAPAGFTRPIPALAVGRDPVPETNVIYIAPTGDDTTGDGSLGSPYRTLERAHDHGSLGAAWTIVMRAGIYSRSAAFTPSKSGISGSPITVMAYPGETVVLDRSAEFAPFRTPGQSLWELYDASLNVWRTKTAGEFAAGRLQGIWKEGSQYYQLWGYLSDGGWGNATSYEGPMVRAQADGRIYVRFRKPLPSYTGTGWPDYVDGVSDGVFAIPASQNPNDYAIYLYRRGTANGSASVYHISGVSWWTFRDLNVYTSDIIAAFDGTCSGVTFERGLWLACRYGTRMISGTTDRISWLGLQFVHGAINHWRYHWIKNVSASGQQDDDGAWNFAAGPNSNHTIEDCKIWNFFDIIIGGSQPPPSNFLVRYNWFDNCRDDCLQMSQNSDGIEWSYNVFYNTPFWGMNFSSATPSTGDVYIHHNAVWQRWPAFWNAGARPGCNKLVISHGSTVGVQPCKIYNNTLIVNSCAATDAPVPLGHCDCRRSNSSSNTHEVYNNLVMVFADELWYNSENGGAEHDHGAVRYSLDGSSNEKYDHNHYARVLAYTPAKSSLIGPLYNHPDKQGGPYYYTSAAALANASENQIEAEVNGTSEDHAGAGGINAAAPLVDLQAFDFRPKSGSALLTGAKDLSGTGWPGGSNASWRGALDPNGRGDEIGPRD